MSKNGIRNRFIIVALFLAFLSYEILSFDFGSGLYIISLVFLCLGSLLKDYVFTGVLNIFTGKNYYLLFYLLLHGIGFFTYHLRLYLGLAVYDHSEDLLNRALLYSVIAVLIFLLSYSFGKRFIHIKIYSFSNVRFKKLFNDSRTKWILLLLGICLFTGLLWGLMGNIPILIENYHQSARAEVGKGLGFIEAISRSLINLSLLYFIVCFKKRLFPLFFWIFALFIISLFLLNMDRGGLMKYLLSIWIVYFVCIKRTTIKHFLVACFLLVILAGAMGAMRTKNLADLAILGGIILTEASVEFDNYVEVFNMTEKDGYLYGSTLVPIATLPVPRVIMPDKDKYLTAGNYFKEYHNHTHIRVGERISYVGELYLNFGFPGIILGMVLVGILLSVVDGSLDASSVLSVYLYLQFINTFSGKGKVIINNGKYKYQKELAKQSDDLRCAVNWFIEVDGGTRLYAITNNPICLNQEGRPYGLIFTRIYDEYTYCNEKGERCGVDWFLYPQELVNISDIYDFDDYMKTGDISIFRTPKEGFYDAIGEGEPMGKDGLIYCPNSLYNVNLQ